MLEDDKVRADISELEGTDTVPTVARKVEPGKRTAYLSIRLTESELARIGSLADQRNISVSAAGRELLLKALASQEPTGVVDLLERIEREAREAIRLSQAS